MQKKALKDEGSKLVSAEQICFPLKLNIQHNTSVCIVYIEDSIFYVLHRVLL